MDTTIVQREQINERKGRLAGGIAFLLVVVLLFLPIIFYQTPPPGQEGILVNLGLPDLGQGDENAGPSAPAEVSEPEYQPEPTPPKPEPTPPTPSESNPQPQEREVVTQEDPQQVAIERRKQQEARERAEAERRRREEEARRQQQLEAERRRQQEAERRRAEAEAARQAEAARTKDQIGGLFGSGSGKGNTGKPGNQGDPEGDPNASRLEGISTGSGRVGGGLGGRGILAAPSVQENSQKQGVVVVRVCVDAAGNVLSADYTQAGSTTTDRQLVQAAVRNARQWRFSRGQVEKQCGTISYNFKVQ